MTEQHERESPKHLYARIRDVLLHQWDPLGLADAAGTPDDYDAYARELHALVTGPEASVERVASYLRWAERVQMGLQRRPGAARGAAERIMALTGEAERNG
jgi:hypothetical protein